MLLLQAEADEKKVKAMRTCVGWFSSPACALIYQVTATPPPRPRATAQCSAPPPPTPYIDLLAYCLLLSNDRLSRLVPRLHL